jgi:hypothetical protein
MTPKKNYQNIKEEADVGEEEERGERERERERETIVQYWAYVLLSRPD